MREVDVDAAAAASRPTCGRQRPIRVRSPAITQIASRSGQRSTTGRPSDARVERLGGCEVDHLEDELANTGDWDAHAPNSAEPVARVDGVEDFTPAERARLAPHFSNVDGPVFALVDLPETVKGAMFARYSRYPGHAAAAVPGRVRGLAARARGGRGRRRRGRPRGGALRAHLRRLRGRLGGPARRRAHRGRVVLERAHQGAAAPAAGGLPRAVHALHRLRRADARRRLPLLPRRRRSGPSTRRRWTRCSTPTREALPRVRAWVDATFPAHGRRVRGDPPARGEGQGAGPAARAAARGVAVAHGHLRHRPGLRAADPAPARAPAAGGARVRRSGCSRRSRP